MKRTLRLVAALALGLVTTGALPASNGPGAAAVNTKRIIEADKEPGNWMAHGRTYYEQRFSPLQQINENNVERLGLAWYYDYNTMRGIEGTPLVVDGVIYSTAAWSVTVALDAKTGKELWRYDPEVPPEWSRFVCCDVVNRGPAVWESKVIVATLDGRLIALDAKTGTPLWSTLTVDNKEWPYSITGAPRVFNGKVVIGNAGVELGVRGYVSAYDVETGKLIWRFWTVPGNPANGFENRAMEMAAKTWSGEWWKQGAGGAVWDSIVYDPDFNRVYIATGNGAPWPHTLRSEGKGDNLFLASIVALDADTGEYVWHFQLVPGESWDYDTTQHMMLADLRIDGRDRKVLMQAPKHGFFYVLDRTDGKLISTGKFIEQNNFASHIDPVSGRPVLLPDAYYEKDGPKILSPNAVGAHSWHPMSYNPMTGLVYFPVLENWLMYEVEENYQPRKFRMSWGTATPPSERNAAARAELASKKTDGWLTAYDPVRHKEVWRVSYGAGGNGGTLTTAGNLVFHGTNKQELVAYRATDGARLWGMNVQTVPSAGPVSYLVDGEQYIAVNAGSGTLGPQRKRSGGRLLAFKLGGTAELPPVPEPPAIPPPPFSIPGSEEDVRRGAALYVTNCAQCHGRDAIGINSIPDLRHMQPGTRAEFKDIVLNGTRGTKGMAGFGDVLTEADAEAVYAYLVARAREDWIK